MLRFAYLDKAEKEAWLPRLFDLLYENMKTVAPGLPYEEEKRLWLSNVSPALEKAPRQMILCFAGEELAGFAQFYTRGELLMVEEVQIAKPYHRSFLFYRLCRFLLEQLPTEIGTVEAYAEKRNRHSLRIMGKLGMEVIGEEGPFAHLRGDAQLIREKFAK